mgnify:CR=1 FL=1|tara:strand:+ start:380 stop:553 length:174 start_codon:yes stop_codon:yes gene_type:complete
MTAITMTYCAMCEALSNFFKKMTEVCETIGTARAANQLYQMGYHKEAKNLMLGKDPR